MPYTTMQQFEWDEEKAEANLKKHRISFPAAAMVFSDPLHLTVQDDRFEYGEAREITFGQVENRVIAVVHTEREGKTRIISARYAEASEVRAYYQLYPRSR